MVEDIDSILKIVSFGTSMVGCALKKGKDNGHFQALCLSAIIEAFKENGVLNEDVDMAVSYCGRVIRNEDAAGCSQQPTA